MEKSPQKFMPTVTSSKVLELMEQGYFSFEKLVTKKIKLEISLRRRSFVELTQDKSPNQDLSSASE